MLLNIILVIVGLIVVVAVGFLVLLAKAHKKVPQGKALIRTGFGGAKVALDSGIFVIPIMHRVEEMDISLKTIEVHRTGGEGLICRDNMRADIKVVFFVRVNKDPKMVVEVAQTIGCARASRQETLNNLFDAKFSEALKTVGKNFDFVDLYTEREKFKVGILETIGTDLNGYILDDCAIDYLEQTPLSSLDEKNILDAQGIKKIEELTSDEQEKTNAIRRRREQNIKEQDVEARTNILRLEKQQIDEEQKQKKEVAELTSTQENAAKQVVLAKNKETSLIEKDAEREIGRAEEDKQREIMMARLKKEQLEKVTIQEMLQAEQEAIQEREKEVGKREVEKEQALEEKKRDIQIIIKERKAEEKKTIEEDQKILDVQEIMEAERKKKVAELQASQEAEMQKIIQTRKAEADKLSAEVNAQKKIIDADANMAATQKEAEARKIAAEALAREEATMGIAEANVMKAKAEAREMEAKADAMAIKVRAEADKEKGLAEAEVTKEKGLTEATVTEQKGLAEATVIEKQVTAEGLAQANVTKAKAEADKEKGLTEAQVIKEKGLSEANVIEQKGLAEAKIIEQNLTSEAKGIEAKANAMKLLDGVGKEHEEFKLKLEQEKEIRIAEIQAQLGIAESQARVLSAALQNAKIDIVGGETKFFDSIINSVNKGKSIDRLIGSSENLQAVKNALLGDGDDNLFARVKTFVDHYNIDTEAIKNLSLSALLSKIYAQANGDDKDVVMGLIETVSRLGLGGETADKIL